MVVDTDMAALSKDAVSAEMRRVFGGDERRIRHALDVLAFAELILEKEPADGDVVTAAALLHDIGIHEAERKYKSTAGVYQQLEGPPIARKILRHLGAEQSLIDEVCEIIARHHTPRAEETDNFKILYDADMIVNLRDDFPDASANELKGKIDRLFFTEEGRRLASDTLLTRGH
jgi:HD superfamily phosphodiesterase